jgi:uncharacterized protein YqeY
LAGTETGTKEISDEIAIKAMQKMAKQRKDSIEIFLKENRNRFGPKGTRRVKGYRNVFTGSYGQG